MAGCLFSDPGLTAEKFIVATPGLSIRYTPLYYGQEFSFFKDEGLDVQVIVVRAGQVGIASLLSGEVDAITHAGTALAAAIRGLPVKIISVTSDRPNHELFVASSVRGPQDLKGKSVGLGCWKVQAELSFGVYCKQRDSIGTRM